MIANHLVVMRKVPSQEENRSDVISDYPPVRASGKSAKDYLQICPFTTSIYSEKCWKRQLKSIS